ncbi:MAG: hypothetical protein ACYTGF_06050 [Planctomycetota bacterium]|jgi:hypothetical protein
MTGFLKRLLPKRDPVNPGDVAPVDFAVDLFLFGLHILPCGGGVIPEPRRAVRTLKRKYGQEGLVRESKILLFESPLDSEYPEGTRSVATGIIYHLADKELFRDLVETRSQWLEDPGDLSGRIRTIEALISGIAFRLKLPCPEGLSPVDVQAECDYFGIEV